MVDTDKTKTDQQVWCEEIVLVQAVESEYRVCEQKKCVCIRLLGATPYTLMEVFEKSVS